MEADYGRLEPPGLIGYSAEFALLDTCSIDITASGGLVIVQLCGEVDAQAVPQLQTTLASALSDTPSSLRIDLSGATYLSLSAMGVILAARARAVRAHTDVVVADAPRALRKLMDSIDEDGIVNEPAAVAGLVPHPATFTPSRGCWRPSERVLAAGADDRSRPDCSA
ncbi:STAS domain-containing protein [Modestobacter sp. VKM Ac-2979]|uniref:STAS domain-containing protein n=1 Tax=unclassified Modestobacter TaxID=2643866 RepID=UPI0022ABA04B|nr:MULTISPECIES: STAS domain-containing protein [unclassified Modestobacter]MCZ2812021.1 STAS domain-containing protein [Modestobacter sp. VKM Ac-2979]MCZ2843745.1 STAS domain-containing protein [Modestobacter sp. VKM Ac-2980]